MRDPRVARVGEEILPFEGEVGGDLPEYFQKKAERELHETADRRTQCVRQLKEMAKHEKRLKNIEFEDEFLIQFVRLSKFNPEKALNKLKTCEAFMRHNPGPYHDLKFDVTVTAIRDDILTFLPWRCQDGCAVILVQLDNWRPDKFPLEEIKKMAVVFLYQALQDPMTQVNGFKVIFDVKSASMRYLRHLTPHNLYLLYHGTQNCVPGRWKSVHIVNDSLTFKMAWIIIKHFFTDKLKQRIHFHSSPEPLLDYFPKAILPVKYGGDLKEYDQTEWLRKVMQPDQLERIGGGILKANVES